MSDYEDIAHTSVVLQKLQQQAEQEQLWTDEDRKDLTKSPYCHHCYILDFHKNKANEERLYYCTMSFISDTSINNKKTGKVGEYYRNWQCRKCGKGKKSISIEPIQYKPMVEE